MEAPKDTGKQNGSTASPRRNKSSSIVISPQKASPRGDKSSSIVISPQKASPRGENSSSIVISPQKPSPRGDKSNSLFSSPQKPSPRGDKSNSLFSSPQKTVPEPDPPPADSEIDALLRKSALPKAAKRFVAKVNGDTGAVTDEHAEKMKADELAARLLQNVQQLHDISWSSPLQPKHCERVENIFSPVLPAIGVISAKVAALDVQAELDKGTSPDEVIASILEGIKACRIYCAIGSICGALRNLVMEEINISVVQCAKLCMKELMARLVTQGEAESAQKELENQADDAAKFRLEVGDMLLAFHKFLSRQSLPEEQLHQLVHMAIGVFFLPDPQFTICAAAEELLVTIFSRHEGFASSVLEDFFMKVTQLPTGKRARKFQLTLAGNSADSRLTLWTKLLLRLVQSTCLPLREPLGSKVDFEALLKCRTNARAVLAQLTTGMLQRLLLASARGSDLCIILEEHIEQLLLVVDKPAWPGALALIRTYAYQLMHILKPDKKKDMADFFIQIEALKLLAKITVELYSQSKDSAKEEVKLPPWTTPIPHVDKNNRLLQNVALRVSLEEDDDMPWTKAAKAMKAWDADLYVDPKKDDTSGLSSFTESIAFRYLILAHLEDERAVSAKCPPQQGEQVTVSQAIFTAAHIAHAWTFLVCDWAAELQQSMAELSLDCDFYEVDGTEDERNIKKLLSSAWTSRTPLLGDGGRWRNGGSRRLILPFTAHKIFRQMQSKALQSFHHKLLVFIMKMGHAEASTCRKIAMRTLADIANVDQMVLANKFVQDTLDMRLEDESPLVRQAALDVLGCILESSFTDEAENIARPQQRRQGGSVSTSVLLRFQRTVRARMNDCSITVVRQASKILSAFLISHPEHEDVVKVSLALLRRSEESEMLKRTVLSTFERIWFMNDEPTPSGVRQFAEIVFATSTGITQTAKLVPLMFTKLDQNLKLKNGVKSDHCLKAAKAWSDSLFKQFVQLNGQSDEGETRWRQSQALLTTLEELANVEPRAVQWIFRSSIVYLVLDERSNSREKWVAWKVCRIISSVLWRIACKPGVIDKTATIRDLRLIIDTQPTMLTYEAARCLCLMVKHVTGDFSPILRYLNRGFICLRRFCNMAQLKSMIVEDWHDEFLAREILVLSTILEMLPLDAWIEQGRVQSEYLQFELVGRRVASSFTDILVTLWNLKSDQLSTSRLKATLITCLANFLCGNRHYTKQRRIGKMFQFGLSHGVPAMRLTTLKALSKLLSHFAKEADVETSVASMAAPTEIYKNPENQKKKQRTTTANNDSSATESAQPLAAYSAKALEHITVADPTKKIGQHDPRRPEDSMGLDIRIEALSVVRLLHNQGLVNPMIVLPKIVALCFSTKSKLAEPAGLMLKDMLDCRTSLLLNRISEAFHDAFILMLASENPPRVGKAFKNQFLTLSHVYAERFGKQKGPRESFIRKLLGEVFRLHLQWFHEHFKTTAGDKELIQATPTPTPTPAAPTPTCVSTPAGFSVPISAPTPMSTPASPTILTPSMLGSPSTPATPGQATKKLKRIRIKGSYDANVVRKEMPASVHRKESIFDKLSPLQRHQVLYAQFVASCLSALPFTYESEPLLIIFECNRALSLHSSIATRGTQLSLDQNDSSLQSPASPECTDAEGIDDHSENLHASATNAEGTDGNLASRDFFCEAVSIVTCIVLKRALKDDFSFSPEQCAQFRPSDAKQERLKGGRGGGDAGAAGDDLGEAAPSAGTVRFRLGDFCRFLEPVVANRGKPKKLAEYIMRLAGEDPWDASHARHEAALQKLLGKKAGMDDDDDDTVKGKAGGTKRKNFQAKGFNKRMKRRRL